MRIMTHYFPLYPNTKSTAFQDATSSNTVLCHKYALWRFYVPRLPFACSPNISTGPGTVSLWSNGAPSWKVTLHNLAPVQNNNGLVTSEGSGRARRLPLWSASESTRVNRAHSAYRRPIMHIFSDAQSHSEASTTIWIWDIMPRSRISRFSQTVSPMYGTHAIFEVLSIYQISRYIHVVNDTPAVLSNTSIAWRWGIPDSDITHVAALFFLHIVSYQSPWTRKDSRQPTASDINAP